CDQLANMRMPYPLSAEQKSICDFLDQETIKFDALVTEAQSAIALLQERRTALISAAVTGKMDVRHLA
ncbi:MAG: restriction endonuclease subunit S, partial [Leptothrix ochracea]